MGEDALWENDMKKIWISAYCLLATALVAEDLPSFREEYLIEEKVDAEEEETFCQEKCTEEPAEECLEEICEEPTKRWGVEARVAWYYPLSGETRKFYDSPILGYQVEGMYQLCRRWQFFGRVAYLEKKGSAEIEVYGGGSSTQYCPRLVLESLDKSLRLRIFQAALGVQYEWCLPCSFSCSLGAGATYSWLWHKHGVEASHYSGYSWYSVGSKNEGMDHALGALIKGSISYDFTRCIRGTLFVDYSATKFSQHDFDFSTVAGGVGVGIYF